jgi:YVTN family beta-propeller protein
LTVSPDGASAYVASIGLDPLSPGTVWVIETSGNTSVTSIPVGAFPVGVAITPAPPVITVPTNKDQCKQGGWRTFSNPSFKNQGDCVSFVVSHPRSR